MTEIEQFLVESADFAFAIGEVNLENLMAFTSRYVDATQRLSAARGDIGLDPAVSVREVVMPTLAADLPFGAGRFHHVCQT
ncbi:MAG: hypothetical protein JWN95_3260 [Frankiales bacterium]|nr:hypothetical protein [Frankiales bacterium]